MPLEPDEDEFSAQHYAFSPVVSLRSTVSCSTPSVYKLIQVSSKAQFEPMYFAKPQVISGAVVTIARS